MFKPKSAVMYVSEKYSGNILIVFNVSTSEKLELKYNRYKVYLLDSNIVFTSTLNDEFPEMNYFEGIDNDTVLPLYKTQSSTSRILDFGKETKYGIKYYHAYIHDSYIGHEDELRDSLVQISNQWLDSILVKVSEYIQHGQ